MSRAELKVGDRVRLSAVGRKSSKLPERVGEIVRIGKTGTQYRVLWRGLKFAQLVHADFLEPLERPATQESG